MAWVGILTESGNQGVIIQMEGGGLKRGERYYSQRSKRRLRVYGIVPSDP